MQLFFLCIKIFFARILDVSIGTTRTMLMVKGSYTESDTNYGNYASDKYEFNPNLDIKYTLLTDKEKFVIEHHCAFMNEIKTRIIPIQKYSSLTGIIKK